ncbi:MAG: DUF2116 family Zn-ribbon domain-containing protein [Nitrososphaerales archaeon]|nr:DUF2116 family Zn-ribbon domain-containing protein [Nitrososphaerales archaeon]
MSVKSKDKDVSIPPHTHCRVCGRSIPLQKDYCSNECRLKEMKHIQRAKRMQRITTLLFLALFGIFILMMYLTKPS